MKRTLRRGALELLRDGYNSGFYREDAFLAIVAISDEDDYSGNSPVSRNEFISWLTNLKSNPDMVSFSSIVGPEGNCSTAIEPGDEYLAVTRVVGGIEWSICNSAWDSVLEELGMQAAGLRREFFLSEVPVEDSITVKVIDDGDERTFEQGTDWGTIEAEIACDFSPSFRIHCRKCLFHTVALRRASYRRRIRVSRRLSASSTIRYAQ